MKTIISTLSLLFFALGGARAGEAERGDGKITFYTYHLKEAAEIRYRAQDAEGGDIIYPQAIKKIESLFRSRDSGKTLPIDLRLVELLDQIEDHFGVRQVEVISGYRSRAFNRELKANGHNVANESLHTKGMAADIHLDEITEEALRDYAVSLNQGGVGFYPSLHMVHVDTGEVRVWGEPGPRKAWVGEKNERLPVRMVVAPDRTLTKRLDSLTIIPEDPMRVVMIGALEIEFFDGGTWRRVAAIPGGEGNCLQTMTDRPVIPLGFAQKILDDLDYGKYRIRGKACYSDQYQYSNEFYLKKE